VDCKLRDTDNVAVVELTEVGEVVNEAERERTSKWVIWIKGNYLLNEKV
jgi:hypothetical protein